MDQFSGSSISRSRSQTKHVHNLQLPAASRAASSRVISPLAPMWCLRCQWLVSRSFLRFALLSWSGVHLATFEGHTGTAPSGRSLSASPIGVDRRPHHSDRRRYPHESPEAREPSRSLEPALEEPGSGESRKMWSGRVGSWFLNNGIRRLLAVPARTGRTDVRNLAGKRAEATARSDCRLCRHAANRFAWGLLSNRPMCRSVTVSPCVASLPLDQDVPSDGPIELGEHARHALPRRRLVVV